MDCWGIYTEKGLAGSQSLGRRATAVEGKDPPSEGRCVGERKGGHGTVEINYSDTSANK
jgi:hypothetical protein